MTRILLLGGTGFIGQAAAKHLRQADYSVISAGRSERADLRIDLSADTELRSALNHADLVINLVGAGLAVGTADARAMEQANSVLPARLAEALNGVPMLHAASSTEPEAMGGEYESEYSRTKHAGTTALRKHISRGAPITLLRIFNAYGPRQPRERFVASTIDSLRRGRQVTLQFPHRVRDFVFIDDVAAAIVAAAGQRLGPSPVPVVEVGTGKGLALAEVAGRIARAVGAPEGLVTGMDRPDPHPSTICPVRYGTLGICRTSFDEGLARTLEAG